MTCLLATFPRNLKQVHSWFVEEVGQACVLFCKSKGLPYLTMKEFLELCSECEFLVVAMTPVGAEIVYEEVKGKSNIFTPGHLLEALKIVSEESMIHISICLPKALAYFDKHSDPNLQVKLPPRRVFSRQQDGSMTSNPVAELDHNDIDLSEATIDLQTKVCHRHDSLLVPLAVCELE